MAKRLLNEVIVVLLLVLQTSQNEIVYSAWVKKNEQQVRIPCCRKRYEILPLVGLPGIWRKGKDITCLRGKLSLSSVGDFCAG